MTSRLAKIARIQSSENSSVYGTREAVVRQESRVKKKKSTGLVGAMRSTFLRAVFGVLVLQGHVMAIVATNGFGTHVLSYNYIL